MGRSSRSPGTNNDYCHYHNRFGGKAPNVENRVPSISRETNKPTVSCGSNDWPAKEPPPVRASQKNKPTFLN